MASRAMMPTGEGRVCTSTTSALSPCPRVTWLVGLASVMARAGKTRARARAGARKIVLDMGVLLVVVGRKIGPAFRGCNRTGVVRGARKLVSQAGALWWGG